MKKIQKALESPDRYSLTMWDVNGGYWSEKARDYMVFFNYVGCKLL